MKKKFFRTLLVSLGVVFLPVMADARTENVNDSQGFYDAWTDSAVTKIELLNDIDYDGKSLTSRAAERTTDIEISGKAAGKEYGHKLNLKKNALELREPTTSSGKAEIHVHDIVLENVGDRAYGTQGGIIEDKNGSSGDSNVTANHWTITFGNVRVPGGALEYTPGYLFDEDGNKTSYSIAQRNSRYKNATPEELEYYGEGETARLARTTRAQINIYGKMSVFTQSENFYTGGLYFAEGTDYNGAITRSDYSAIWFRSTVVPGDTGTGNFIVDDNASVKVRNTNDGSGYPAIYRFVRNIEVGENSDLTLTVPGNSLQFVGANQNFTAKKGSRVTLGSTKEQPSIMFSGTNGGGGTSTEETKGSEARNAKMTFEPGSSLFIIGNSKSSMIDMSSGTDSTILLDTPLQFDIRNTVKGTKNIALEMDSGRTETGNKFIVQSSNMDFWDVNTDIKGSPKYSYNDVVGFSARHTNRAFDFVTTDTRMQSELPAAEGKFARITGLNTVPVVEWPTIMTDADKKHEMSARVKLGEVPNDDGMDNDGNLVFEPIYAGKNQAEVTVNDTKDTFPEKKILTNSDGYVVLNNPNFYEHGTQLKVVPRRSGLIGKEQLSPKIKDITPPNIMKKENLLTTLTTNTKKIKAENLEPNATVYVKINDAFITDNGKNNKVKADGTWEFNLNKKLMPTDTIKFYLEDESKKMLSNISYVLEDPFLGAVERYSTFRGNIPATNNERGNRNPDMKTSVFDAEFEGVIPFNVQDLEPPTPRIDKLARALTKDDKGNQIPQGDGSPITSADWQGKITKVNNTLSYRIGVRIPGTKGEDLQKVLYNAHITDKIPDYLTFKKEDVKVWKYNKGDARGMPIRYTDNVIGADGKHQFNMGDINLEASEATPIANPIVEYNESTKELTVGIGDRSKNIDNKYIEYGYEGDNKYGHLLPGDNVVIEFPTVVTSDAVKNTIKNVGKITGYSAEEISADPLEYKKVSVTSNEALNPGGEVSGELLLTSAPKDITFKNTNLIDYGDSVLPVKVSDPLIVKDTLKDANWEVMVKLTK